MTNSRPNKKKCKQQYRSTYITRKHK